MKSTTVSRTEGKKLETLVRKYFDANEEYSRLTGEPIEQSLMEGATPAQLKKVEEAAAMSLPDDYREMLQLHNGWQGFYEEANLLGSRDIAGGKVQEWLKELRKSWLDAGQRNPAEGFVIVAGVNTTYVAFFDRKSRTDGGHDLVVWNESEVARHKTFSSYLQKNLEVVQKLIRLER